jgi:chloramphenicol 3-O-phosphotransferase
MGRLAPARALQARLETPHVHLAEDSFWAMLPERDTPVKVRYRLYCGFLSCIAALAERENSLIVDTVADDRDALFECARHRQAPVRARPRPRPLRHLGRYVADRS